MSPLAAVPVGQPGDRGPLEPAQAPDAHRAPAAHDLPEDALTRLRALGLRPITPPGLDPALAIWLGNLDDAGLASRAQRLDAAEQQRMQRFRFAQDRSRFAATRVLLRALLGEICHRPPQAMDWLEGAFGKPALRPGSGPHFNVSHCDSTLLIATNARRPVGVDVEAATRLADEALPDLAERCFSPRELHAFRTAPAAQRRLLFLQTWTRKEACLKALGSGLSIEPQVFDAGPAGLRASVNIPVGAGVAQMVVDPVPIEGHGTAAVSVLDEASLGWAR